MRPKVVASLLGHSTVSVTLDTHSYVKPGLVRQATEVLATLVARRTIGSGLAASADRLPERPNSGSVPWCRRRDSNPHGVHPQRFLRPPRLPFRHSGASSSKVYRLSSQTCTLPPPQPQRRTPAALHPPVSQATSAPLVALLARRHRTLPHQCWHLSHPTHDRQVQQSADAWCVAHEGCGQDNGHPYLASGPPSRADLTLLCRWSRSSTARRSDHEAAATTDCRPAVQHQISRCLVAAPTSGVVNSAAVLRHPLRAASGSRGSF